MNIEEFANAMAVSTATVSRAFGHRGRISAATRARILEGAQQLGYRPNHAASSMARGRSDSLGFFYEVPEERHPDFYVAELTTGVIRAAAKYGMGLRLFAVVAAGEKAVTSAVDALHSGAVDGFVMNLHPSWSGELLKVAAELCIPYVVIDNTRVASETVLSLRENIKRASEKVGSYLREKGCRHPVFMRGIHDRAKVEGMRQGLREIGDYALLEWPGGFSFDDARRSCSELLTHHPETDALFCANDVLAQGAICAGLNAGLSIPDDLSVVGCDDVSFAAFLNPALTTIRLPKMQLGEFAVDCVMNRLNGHPCPSEPSLDCELVIRDSA